MAAPISSSIKLRDCIFSYMESSKVPETDFLRLWRMAFRGFKQMGLNGFWEPVTERITVNDNKTATFPANCIVPIKVGQINAQGEFQTLAVNNDLTNYKDLSSNRIADLTPEVQEALIGPAYFNNYGFYGNNVGEDGLSGEPDFGLGSHLLQPGECKIDKTNRVIILNTNYQYPHVFFMFLGAPDQNTDYEIPLQYEGAMIAWLAWKDIEHMPATSHMAGNAAIMRQKNFGIQCRLAKKMYKPFNITEANQLWREKIKYAIKG